MKANPVARKIAEGRSGVAWLAAATMSRCRRPQLLDAPRISLGYGTRMSRRPEHAAFGPTDTTPSPSIRPRRA